jgi:hypothetical protein
MTTKTVGEKSVPEQHAPQGHIAGVPYDVRRPSLDKTKARWWNESDPHLFTPKVFGAGWDLNLYWATHPAGYVKGRRRQKDRISSD